MNVNDDDHFEPSADGTCDHSGEELLHDCCRELGVNMAVAMQILAWADEKLGYGPAPQRDLTELRRLNERHRKAWQLLISYQSNQKTFEDACMSTRVMALVLGFKTAAGAETIAEMERKTGIKKQTLNKPRIIFREKLGLPPEGDERGATARGKMADARKQQLATKGN